MSEVRWTMTDFFGGFNSNTRIGANELQEAVDVDITDMGKIRPRNNDTLVIDDTDIDCVRRLGGSFYYTVGTTLYKDGEEMGDIGQSMFTALKSGGIVLIISDACYKIIDGTLHNLGVIPPDTAPTVAAKALLTYQINALDATTGWTAANCSVAVDSTNYKEGSKSLKITPSTEDVLATITKGSLTLDLTEYEDGTESSEDDFIILWIYVNDNTSFSYLQISFDCNTGDFKNDFYRATAPILATTYTLEDNDEHNRWFSNWRFIDLDQDRQDWETETENPESISYNPTYSFNRRISAELGSNKKKQATGKIVDHSATWTRIRIRKSDFYRHGDTDGKDWSTITAIQIGVMCSATGLEVSVDDLKLKGGGHLDDQKYSISYSYVAKFNLPGGVAYEEESQLSPETEITLTHEQQDLYVSAMANSDEDQVTHKRVYLRGGRLTKRHLVTEIAYTTTSCYTTMSESDLVSEAYEDCRKNGLPPADISHNAVISNGRLFVFKGKDCYFSRPDMLSAFRPEDYFTLDDDIVAQYEKGANIALMTDSRELIYVNPGFTSTQGGYLHYAEFPYGCTSVDSASKGFHMTSEGVVYFSGTEPALLTDKIRSEIIDLDKSDCIGAYQKGSYYFILNGNMYRLDQNYGRFLKYADIDFVTAGDDGEIYILQEGLAYRLEDGSNYTAFSFRTPEVVTSKDNEFRNIVIDAYFGDVDTTIEYYVNDVSTTSVTKTTTGRQLIHIPISQKKGNRISVRISVATTITEDEYAIYGVSLE